MAGGGGGEQDLNLVPYMDIMVNLLMFMIVVTSLIVELKEAPILAPAYSPNAGGPKPTDEEKPKPFLTVAIATNGLAVLASSDEVVGSDIPKVNGQYDYPRLTATLRQYKASGAVAENLVITADGKVPYSALIHTMDAARTDTQGDLFRGVTLGVTLGAQ